MNKDPQYELNQGLDFILDQLEHGNTIEGLKKGKLWRGFEQVKEWRSKFGYQFHIYSNDHFIDNKPHFHLIKKSEGIDCRLFFNGQIIDCGGNKTLRNKVVKALDYFLSQPEKVELLNSFWNAKNPNLIIQNKRTTYNSG